MAISGFQAGGTLDTIVNATLDKSRRKLYMASIKSNALMAWMLASERVETEDGGANITNPLIVGRNGNVGTYQYYDSLPVAQSNEFATIGYGWSRFAGTFVISDQEVDENTGETALFKIITEKMKVLEESIGEKFSEYCYGAGGGTDPLGLAALIADDPTAGTLGGRSRVTDPQWRTSAYQFAGALDATNIEEALDDILMDLKLKNDKPSVLFMGRNNMRILRQAARDKFTIPLDQSKKGKAMFDLGFDGMTHNGIPIIYDEDCGVNRTYFINDKYIRAHVLKGVNMRRKDLIAPWTVDAIGKRVVWQGQFANWLCFRRHAVMRNGTTG